MSDPGLESGAVGVVQSGSPALAGDMLRDAREAQGLHIAALAVALKVPVKKLEALEAGRYDELPDMVFARSLALSVCRALKVDPTPVMASLPEPNVNQFKTSQAGLNTAFKDDVGASHNGLKAQISSPIGLGALALVVAIAVILAWPSKSVDNESAATLTTSGLVAPVASPDSQNLQTTTDLGPAIGAVNAASEAMGQPSDTQPSQQAVENNPVPEMGLKVTATLPASGSVAVTNVGSDAASLPSILELIGRGESWVDVTDGTGQSQLRKLMQSGETIRLTGQLPLSVTIGRADMVAVSVRGKPMDLTPLARNNVARFEVK